MFYWIDTTADVAYVAVRGALPDFSSLLAIFDRLLADARWHPDMPIVEDVREITVHPPRTCIEDWRTYLRERRTLLSGVRWAIVAPDADERLRSILSAAAVDAAAHHVAMQIFSSTIDAHAWLARRGPVYQM